MRSVFIEKAAAAMRERLTTAAKRTGEQHLRSERAQTDPARAVRGPLSPGSDTSA